MINFNIFELTQDLEKLHASLMRRKGAVIEVVRARMTAVFTQLAAKIVVEKLSGDPLGRRTGILAGSVHVIPAHYESASRIVAAVEAAGAPAGYGRIQEMGVSHPWTIINAHASVLHWIQNGRDAFAKSVIHPPMMGAQGWFSSYDSSSTREWMLAELKDALNEGMKE